jgi:hypothetical protein
MQVGFVAKSYASLAFFGFKESLFLYILDPFFSAVVQPRAPALSLCIWAHQFVDPGLFSAPKLTDLYRKPSVST